MLIAVLGFQQHKWPSVERTRLFYERALSAEFQLRIVADGNELVSVPEPDLILNFGGSVGWELDPRPDCPLAFALHGGTVIDYEFLAERVPRYRDTDIFLVNCRSDEAILQSLVEGTVRTARLSLPVDLTTFRRRDKTECRSLLPVTADFLLGFVARLIPQKNLHGFLDILAKVKARLAPKTVHGLVIGNYWLDYPVLPYCTAQYPALIQQTLIALDLQRDVTFLPASLTDEQLALCYAGMDVLVHPTSSIDENFGYAPVEAMGCGTPVVGTAYGGLKDTVLHGKTGYLIQTWMTPNGIRMDTAAAVDAVTSLLKDIRLCHGMSVAATRHVASNYSEAACGLVLRKALRETIRTSRERTPVRMRASSPRRIDPKNQGTGGLPDVSPPWGQYVVPVSHYVSGSPPEAGECLHFLLAGRSRIDQGGTVTLEDPAWPARYQLGEADLSLIEIVRGRGTVSPQAILEAFPFEPQEALTSRLQRLMDVGILVGSKASA